MRAFYPSAPKADIATWLRPKGPIFKGDAEAVEELFAARRVSLTPQSNAHAPTITRPVEVATIAAPQMRSSPSAPLLLNAASPGVPGPAFHFVQAPRDLTPSPQVAGFEHAPLLRGAPQPMAPQHTMFAQMPGPCRQRSAPVLLGAQQAATQNPAGTVVWQSKELPVRQAGAPDRGAHATLVHSPACAVHMQAHATLRRPEADGMQRQEMSKPCLQAGGTPPFAMPDGKPAVPCRQQSAPVASHPQVVVVTTTRCPEGPWMQTAEAPKETKEAPAASVEGSKHKVPHAKAAQRLQSPPATSSRRREAAVKSSEAALDAFVRHHRRRMLVSSCMAAWAAQWRASARAKMTASIEQCRRLQEEVKQKAAAAKQAEVELMRRTEDEFKRLREVQTELLHLQQEAPALQAVNQVHSAASFPKGHRIAKLCFFGWRKEARNCQHIFKLLHPSRRAEERGLLHCCWAVWQPLVRQRRCQAALLKLATRSADREAKAWLQHSFFAWHGQALKKTTAKGGDIFTMGTAPLSAALTYQSAVIRDRPETTSPASTRPLDVLPKAATNGMREGDATPPPPPPPRRNSVPGAETKPDAFSMAAERLQEAKMVEIPSLVLPAARPGGVQWRAAVWPMPADSSRQAAPFAAQRPGGEKVMLRLGQAKYCEAS